MELTLDKSNYILSKRYAQALIELSVVNKKLEIFYTNLLSVLEIYKNSESFKETMIFSSIEKNKKKEVLKDIFEGQIDETVLNFLYVLIDECRFDCLETIAYCFKEKMDKINNIINANVVSSTDFTDGMKKNLKDKLERKTGKNVNIKYSTDESLIAGFILTLGEQVVDLSLKNKINEIKKQLI